MRRNIIGIIFLGIVALFALWFIVKAGSAILSYYQLSVKVPIKVERWSIEEMHSDKFAVTAHFSYDYKGKSYQSAAQVGDFFPNPWAANRAQKLYASHELPAWLNPKHPEGAVLEKEFPVKKALSAAVLIGLLIYFLILSTYVKVRHGK